MNFNEAYEYASKLAAGANTSSLGKEVIKGVVTITGEAAGVAMITADSTGIKLSKDIKGDYDFSVTVSTQTLEKAAAGKVNIVTELALGRIKTKGSLSKLMKLVKSVK